MFCLQRSQTATFLRDISPSSSPRRPGNTSRSVSLTPISKENPSQSVSQGQGPRPSFFSAKPSQQRPTSGPIIHCSVRLPHTTRLVNRPVPVAVAVPGLSPPPPPPPPINFNPSGRRGELLLLSLGRLFKDYTQPQAMTAA